MAWPRSTPRTTARLAQSVEHETLNLRVVGSSPTLGASVFAVVVRCTRAPYGIDLGLVRRCARRHGLVG